MNNEINKKILIHLVTDENIIIKNQIISYILGFYEFMDFKSTHPKNKIITSFYHPKKKFKNIIKNSIYEALVQNELRSLRVKAGMCASSW
jgi:hypothetical protein